MNLLTFNYAMSKGGFYQRYQQMLKVIIKENNVYYISTTKIEDHDNLCQDIIKIKYKNKLFFWGLFFFNLKREITKLERNNNIDKVIVFGPSYAYLYNLFSQKHNDIILFIRSDPLEGSIGNLPGFLRFIGKYITRKGILYSNKIIVQTHIIKQLLINNYSIEEDAIYVLPNNILLKKKVDNKKIINKNKIKISMISKLIDPKRPDIFIEIIDSLRKRGIYVEGLIVGDGPKRKILSNKVKKSNITITGWVNDTYSILSQVDFNILATENEGFPNIFLETINQEIPFFCSDITVLRSIINYDRILFTNDQKGIMKVVSEIENAIQNEESYNELVDISKNLKLLYSFNWEKKVNTIINEK